MSLTWYDMLLYVYLYICLTYLKVKYSNTFKCTLQSIYANLDAVWRTLHCYCPLLVNECYCWAVFLLLNTLFFFSWLLIVMLVVGFLHLWTFKTSLTFKPLAKVSFKSQWTQVCKAMLFHLDDSFVHVYECLCILCEYVCLCNLVKSACIYVQSYIV